MKQLNETQKVLLTLICNSGELVFAAGPKGVSANLVGEFKVERNSKGEDQLNVGNGTNHVHIDWSIVSKVEIGDFHGEGMLSFLNDKLETLFKIYRLSGAFGSDLSKFQNRELF